MKRFICLLVAVLVFGMDPVRAEAAKVYTGQVHPALPDFTITVTDTGEDNADGENLLCAAICPEAGGEGQQLFWHSVESPAFERIAPLVQFQDMNFDGFQDLLLLHAQGASNVFWALCLWDEEAQRFRPPEQLPVWDSEAGTFPFQTRQLALCNPEPAPLEKRLYSVVSDGYRYRTELVYTWESRYGLTVTAVADVYDAGEGQIGERVVLCGTQTMRCWDETYPESWYYSKDDAAFERSTAMRYLTRGTALQEPCILRVANVDWVNLRSRDSKASPSLAELNAGEEVYGLVFGCGQDGGWTLVWQPGATLDTPGRTGYIWHSFLEEAAPPAADAIGEEGS